MSKVPDDLFKTPMEYMGKRLSDDMTIDKIEVLVKYNSDIEEKYTIEVFHNGGGYHKGIKYNILGGNSSIANIDFVESNAFGKSQDGLIKIINNVLDYEISYEELEEIDLSIKNLSIVVITKDSLSTLHIGKLELNIKPLIPQLIFIEFD